MSDIFNNIPQKNSTIKQNPLEYYSSPVNLNCYKNDAISRTGRKGGKAVSISDEEKSPIFTAPTPMMRSRLRVK